MKADVKLDFASRRKMQRAFDDYIRLTGKTAEDGVAMIAFSTARRLVNITQPFGMNGDEFLKNIRAQIEQVWWEVNVGAMPPNSIENAHNRARKLGRLRLRSTKLADIKYYKNIIRKEEAEPYIRRQQRKAGRIKAAWVTAANKIGKEKMSRIPAWIARHVGSSYGDCQKSGHGMKHKIILENSTPYLTTRLVPKAYLVAALDEGLRNGYKRIQKIIDKEIEKANRAMQ